MKQTISYRGKKVFLGIDVHREFFVVSAISEGRPIKTCRVPARFEVLYGFITKYFPEAEIISCYEAGYSGFWLHRKLEGAGIKNIVVHPSHIEVEANRVKTDKRDSLKMAQQLSAGRLRGIRVPSIEQEEKRLLTRTREQLMRARRRAQVQVRMRLHQFGLIPSVFSRVLTQRLAESFLKESKSEALKNSLEYLMSEWRELEGKLKQINRQLIEQAKNDPTDAVYRSVPGVGWLIARILSNELGDMSQFPNERALFSYTGLTPGEYSSGDKVRRGHISRQGNPRLRHVLVQAAWKATKRDPELGEFYKRIAVRRGKNRAIVAVARKLIGRIRGVFLSRGRYELNYKKAA